MGAEVIQSGLAGLFGGVVGGITAVVCLGVFSVCRLPSDAERTEVVFGALANLWATIAVLASIPFLTGSNAIAPHNSESFVFQSQIACAAISVLILWAQMRWISNRTWKKRYVLTALLVTAPAMVFPPAIPLAILGAVGGKFSRRWIVK
ncbi:MAG: hypothetical protein IAG10_10095 [Planctomycetaceae bacterium]|nr:hypothetical protein [Planctomycetaceae bacterium]